MVFKKRVYKRKKLTKSNIFGKKSAKAQAKQIYALNKKVNYIQKTTAPETKTYSNVLFYFDNYNGSTLIDEYHHRYDLYKERILNKNLTRYLNIDGDLLRVKNIYIYGYFGLKQWDYLTDTDPQQNLNVPRDAYLKITVARVIKGSNSFPNTLYETLPNLSSNSDPALQEGIPINFINGPMKDGITSQLQILKKKVIHITPAKTSKMMKIKLFNSKKCNLNYRIGTGSPYENQGEIFIYVDFISPVSLYRTDVNPNRMVAPRVVAQFNYKLVYSDDGTQIVDTN